MLTANDQFSLALDVSNIGSGAAREIKAELDSDNFVALGSAVL